MRKIVMREVDSMALFKISFVVFSFIGLVFGLFFLITTILTFSSISDFPGGENRFYIIFRSSIGAMLLMILYGIISSFAVLILAKIYNMVSRRVGGITFYLDDEQIED